MKLLKVCAALIALMIGHAAQAEDLRVKTRLDAAKLNYEIDSDGDFTLVFETDGDRSHLVFVNSATNKVRGMEIREVWAVAMRADTIPPDVAIDMLKRNSQYKIGSWNITEMGGQENLFFVIHLDALAPAQDLADAAWIVAQNADEIEKHFLGSDEY